MEHPPGGQRQGDIGTGFGVGGLVGEVKIIRETLAVSCGAGSTGDVHPLLDGIVEQSLACCPELDVVGFGRHINGARQQIERANRMALDGLLLHERSVGLKVLGMLSPFCTIFAACIGLDVEVEGLRSSLGYKESRQVAIALIVGGTIEFHQCEFDFRVAAVAAFLAFIGPKGGGDMVGVAAEAVEKFAFAGAVVVSDGRLHQMAGTVELMHVAEVAPAFFLAARRYRTR